MNTTTIDEIFELLDSLMNDEWETVEVKTGEHGRCIGYCFTIYGDCYEFEDGYVEFRNIGD